MQRQSNVADGHSLRFLRRRQLLTGRTRLQSGRAARSFDSMQMQGNKTTRRQAVSANSDSAEAASVLPQRQACSTAKMR